MDYSLEHPSDTSSWIYSQHDTSLRPNTHEPLQEPVPFEDFQFSFGLDPDFVMPVPLDMPEPPTLTDSTNHLLSMDYQLGSEEPKQQDYTSLLAENNPLLDENDQKVFSQFLDAFFVDKDGHMSNAEEMANQFSTMYDTQQPPLLLNDHGYNLSPPPMDPYHVATSMFLPKQQQQQQQQQSSRPSGYIDNNDDEDDDDEHRRSSILQSLDQQKQLHQRLNRVVSIQQLAKDTNNNSTQQESIGPNAIFLQQSNQVSAPFITKHSTRYHAQQHAPYPPPEQRQQAKSLSTPTRRNKSHKELLTEEEKRSNHIASEQKRRSTIRNGFKDLTDIVPTLKNINNSKSTVLFKAVDYIKYLEKRNNNLRDKMGSLEVRIKVEGRVSDLLMHPTSSSSLQQQQQQQQTMAPSHSSPISYSDPSPQDTPYRHRDSDTSSSTSSSSNTSTSSGNNSNSNDNNNSNNSSGGVAAALLAHKSQQKQLMALQEQLQYHQRLLAQQDDSRYHTSSPPQQQSSDLYQHSPRWTYDPKSNNYNNNNNNNNNNSKNNNTNKDPVTMRMEVDNEKPMKVSA
ncbi:hypothetical protein BC941DRAFT_474175 [Chlamydoabsidia padenii]|nr:hypothetical protein BC941DRAFT_474175 [Chlamydoabsidia padenii]